MKSEFHPQISDQNQFPSIAKRIRACLWVLFFFIFLFEVFWACALAGQMFVAFKSGKFANANSNVVADSRTSDATQRPAPIAHFVEVTPTYAPTGSPAAANGPLAPTSTATRAASVTGASGSKAVATQTSSPKVIVGAKTYVAPPPPTLTPTPPPTQTLQPTRTPIPPTAYPLDGPPPPPGACIFGCE